MRGAGGSHDAGRAGPARQSPPAHVRRPAPSGTSPQLAGRFPLVDAARALAAISVLVFHVGVLGGLPAASGLHPYNDLLSGGVTLFFLISGFLLYRPFVAARSGRRRVDLRSYMRKRILRILPGYWVALTVLTVLFGLPDVFTGDWWRYYGLLQIYDLDTYDLGMGVAWTLCIEATFYLVLPLWSLAVGRVLRRGRDALRTELWLLAAGALVAIAFAGSVYFTGRDERISRTLLGTFDWFALGMAFAVLSVHRPALRLPRPELLWTAAAAILLLLGVLGGDREVSAWYQLARHVLVGVAAALLLAPAVFPTSGRKGPVGLLLRQSWLRWLGVISYGLYLYHATLIPPQLSRGLPSLLPGADYLWLLAGTCVLSGAAAAASWYAIERPATGLRPRRRSPRAAGASRAALQPLRASVPARRTSAESPSRRSSARTSGT